MTVDNANCGGEFATNCDDRDDNDKTIYFSPSSHFLCLCCTPSVVIELSVGYLRLLSFVLYRSRFLLKNREERGLRLAVRGYKTSVEEFFV